MHIRILGLGPRIHLLSFFDFQRAVASGEVEPGENRHWDDWSARSFFRQHFCGSHEIGALRQALAPDLCELTRLSDEDVLDTAARRLREGIWRVGYERVRPANTGGGAPAQASAGPPALARRSVEAPVPRRQPASPRAASVGVPASATPAEPEWTEDTDQVAFADGLVRAAQEEIPFCVVCAALRAQQAAALA